ncbi:Rib/alpha-like domain-containing protein, partial [Corynebacterium sp. HMSC29G08]|uniref:Rib/alpha-like domain-containing protein n=1 Tax=Corynebacterium sp. HMSC29G08 TaxID=1581069 RepID=UPI000AABEF89
VIDEVTVKITEPSKTIADQTDPDWKDKETNPGEPVNVPNEGDQLPQGSKVEVSGGKNGWNIKVDGDGSTIVVTPPASAKPGDKITVPVKVTYPDNSVDTDDFTVTVKDPNAGVKNPDWNDGKTEPTKPVDLPNVGGPVKDGTTVETEGPGTAKLNPNDSITVTPGDDAKPGDTIKVTVKDKDGKVIDTVKVTITKPGSSTPGASSLTEDERNRCIAVSVGFGLPLAALVPLGLAMRMNIPGLSPVVDQLSIQIQRVNNDLQNSLGVFNPEAARAAQQLDANLRAFGLDLVSLGAGLAAVVAGIAAIAAVASACTPGDGSSVGTIEGQVGSTPAGSAKQSSERGSSVKVTEE